MKMFDNFYEADSYADALAKKEKNRIFFIMEKEGKFIVAKGWDERDYGIKLGWRVATFPRPVFEL